MQVIESIAAYREWRATVAGSLGFVPTMGALHIGHESLIARSVAECDATVLSIYVNPTQFDNPDDLAGYPDHRDKDLQIAEKRGVDVVFAPRFEEIYPDGFRYQVDETELSRVLCGAHRAGHFTGVLTVVMKLLNIVAPQRAYFGEKDFQQFELIRGMAEAFFLPVTIVPCPTVREPSGLAFSSRNLNLTEEDKTLAPLMHQLISSDLDDASVIEQLTEAGFSVDYIESRGSRRYAAARLGRGAREVRLVDNVARTGEPA